MEVDWRNRGFGGAKLAYLLADSGLFHEAHRAIDDCHAVLEILARPLRATKKPALAALLASARRKTFRIWAENAPYDLKDVLKRRGYRWSDGSDGSVRSWRIDIDEDKFDAEMDYLQREIYQDAVEIRSRLFTARERFSGRF